MEMARIFLFVASLVVADGWIPGMSLRHGHQHHYHHAYTGDSAIYRMLRLMKPAHPPHNPVYHHPHPPPPPHDAPLIQPSVEDSQSMRNPGMHSPHPHADPGSRMYSGGETMQLFFLILVFVCFIAFIYIVKNRPDQRVIGKVPVIGVPRYQELATRKTDTTYGSVDRSI